MLFIIMVCLIVGLACTVRVFHDVSGGKYIQALSRPTDYVQAANPRMGLQPVKG
jgi:hypothetical protein